MLRKRLVFHIFTLILSVSALVLGCEGDWIGGADSRCQVWERVGSVKSEGFSVEKLEKLRNYCSGLNTTALMVISNGKVLFEYGDVKVVSYVASVRKSVLSMLYGKHVVSGSIDLKRSIRDLKMDDVGGLLDIERSATIEHLIAARSGIYHAASNGGDNLSEAPARGSQVPGSYFLYNNWDFNAAGAVFEKLTGRNIFDAVEEDLAKPLGMQDFDRSIHRKGGDLKLSKYPCYHLLFSTRDMAKIGQLMLDMGKWKGKQLMSAKWLEKSVSVITPSEEMNPNYYRNGEFGYGYMWWVWDGKGIKPELQGAYCARGAYGQYITVIPSMNIVIVHKVAVPPRKYVSWKEYRKIVDMVIDAKPAI